MTITGHCPSRVGLDKHGIIDPGNLHWNLDPSELIERALQNGEAVQAQNGALVCLTGKHTGRAPKDKFVVKEVMTKDQIWWGPVNQPISEENFNRLHQKIVQHYRGRDLYVRDMFAGAEPGSRIGIRVITETAWHQLFASQLFIKPEPESTGEHDPDFTILNAPTCLADPQTDGTNSETFIVLNFAKKLILIGGTQYAGEIKKSIFSVMNYRLPTSGILSMHCSANIGSGADVALFFGLSGTGKTTLSADPERNLIGDDEHGWSDTGVFNIEGGCYAKCIKLSQATEPQIFNAIREGAVLENVVMDKATGAVDYDSVALTENTRAAYPLEHMDNAVIPSVGGHPKNVVFLTCDAFGVLPPISKLSPEQAMYHFLSGYTAKVAGTEAGVTEPQATFSACFGAPFLPLPPQTYATMLGERIAKHNVQCWLINTGWSGGGYGVGQRMKLSHTRAMVKAALAGHLNAGPYVADPIFGVSVPQSCPHVPAEVLVPKNTWQDASAYEEKAKKLAGLFQDNFKTFTNVPANIASAGPKV